VPDIESESEVKKTDVVEESNIDTNFDSGYVAVEPISKCLYNPVEFEFNEHTWVVNIPLNCVVESYDTSDPPYDLDMKVKLKKEEIVR
jgi:hypothetical protein